MGVAVMKICFSWRDLSVFLASFLVFISFQMHFCLAVNTMLPERSITGNETIFSPSESFELGFFTPANSQYRSLGENRYLGIWYRKVSVFTVVWVANRETPLTDSAGVFKILNDGNLLILNGDGSSVWSTNISRVAKNPTANLLDSGNLIIIEAQDDAANDKNYLWQSFDYPTDTLLPSMKLGLNHKTGMNWSLTSWRSKDDPYPGDYSYKLDRRGSPQLFIFCQNSTPRYRTGPWMGDRFSGTPELIPGYVQINFNFISNHDEIYYSFSILDGLTISRLVMTRSGLLQRFFWNGRQWDELWQNPKDQCDRYGECGPFGFCNGLFPQCSCLQGFEPKSESNWSSRSFSGGCRRRTLLNCGKEEGFLHLKEIKLADTSEAQVVERLSLEDCRDKCLNDCSCTAYAKTNGDGNGCLIWRGELMDIRRLPGNRDELYVRVAASDLVSNPHNRTRAIVITTISIVLILALGSAYLWWRRTKRKVQEGSNKSRELLLFNMRATVKSTAPEISASIKMVGARNKDQELLSFDLDCIAVATHNFSDTNKVGEGGFGPVYKGKLPNGQQIAVKRLSKISGQGLEEFKNEVLLIYKLQHRNLVRLFGCCIEREENILIYEYMSNKSLDLFLFDQTKSSILDWGKRFNIIIGIARGLLYLHQDSRLRVIHRDLKASNILLDDHLNPKIADFGMARIFGGNQTEAVTRRVVGTHGYMSPEYIIDGVFSEKSDVFSFGVLLLEIISGKRNKSIRHSDHFLSLLGYVWNLWKEDKCIELIDPAMGDSYSMSEVLRSIQVGLLCVQEWATTRPTMSYVLFMLGSESTTLPLPEQPAFVIERTISMKDYSSNKNVSSSIDNITVSLGEGR